jgi:hypothetical protein
MELTFPPLASASESTHLSGRAMLARAFRRQARSRTVRLMRQSDMTAAGRASALQLRMEYFASMTATKLPVCGAFWPSQASAQFAECGGNQSDSANIKADALSCEMTGEQFNHAGHGALRKS